MVYSLMVTTLATQPQSTQASLEFELSSIGIIPAQGPRRNAPPTPQAFISLDSADIFSMSAPDIVSSTERDDTPVRKLLSFCESHNMTNLAIKNGLMDPCFTPNPFAALGNLVYDRFLKALHKAAALQGEDTHVEIVYHGTKQINVEDILRNGLDPERRKSQTFGPGEYFSRRPHMSIGYCGGDKEMLVFCVLVPDKSNTPQSYVVVPNVEHQFPLGTIIFTSVPYRSTEQSQQERAQIMFAYSYLELKKKKAEEATEKAAIIQLLIRKSVNMAGSRFKQHYKNLGIQAQREISKFAHDLFEKDVLCFYFDDKLPAPMSSKEFLDSRILSVEMAEMDLTDAQKAYNDQGNVLRMYPHI